jgi:hypothetical protein
MSDFNSEDECGDAEQRERRRQEMCFRGGVGPEALKQGVKVWERITKAYRSAEVRNCFAWEPLVLNEHRVAG